MTFKMGKRRKTVSGSLTVEAALGLVCTFFSVYDDANGNAENQAEGSDCS